MAISLQQAFLVTYILYVLTAFSAFDSSNLDTLRHLIRTAIIEEKQGLTIHSPNTDPLDIESIQQQPLLASIVRLVFHDCAGINLNDRNDADFAYCNGCINLDDPQHIGLEEGAVIPLENICDLFSDTGLSYADCWALSATFALELAAENAVTTLEPFGIVNDLEIKPGDIPYYIGRDDCNTSPTTSTEQTVEFPNPMLGWNHIEKYFKDRFPDLSNREIVALIGGGHSLGRGHLRLSGFSSAWDASPQALDRSFFEGLINNDPVQRFVAPTIPNDWFQTNMDPDFAGSNRQWSIKWPQYLADEWGLVQETNFLMLNTDIALAFDISSWIKYGKEKEIDCHVVASYVCGNKTVIVGGYDPDWSKKNSKQKHSRRRRKSVSKNERRHSSSSDSSSNRNKRHANRRHLLRKYRSDSEFVDDNDEICEVKQCPVQCPSTIEGVTNEQMLKIIMENGIDNLDSNSQCTRAFVEEFGRSNTVFVKVFVEAFTKMITAGYMDENGHVFLDIVV